MTSGSGAGTYGRRLRAGDPALLRALAGASPQPFWLDDPAVPVPSSRAALAGDVDTDLVVVGGGYSGLWTALQAKERHPDRDVVLLEARTCGWAASGRNGGFCASSLTHGLAHGAQRFPRELARLERLGLANLDGIERTLQRHGIDAHWERTGELDVAVEPWQVAELRMLPDLGGTVGRRLEWLDAQAARERVRSPVLLGGVLDTDGVALVHPGRLAHGLRAACLALGVRLYEHSPASGLQRWAGGVAVATPAGRVRARRSVLATNAFRSLLRRVRPYVVPVCDYALVTEPLEPARRAALRWAGREGVSDGGNQFHYYRLTRDDRVLWGGYDAVYAFRGRAEHARLQRPESFLTLAEHFFTTFPQLEGVRFSHAWGGVVDTSTRFTPFWGTALGGRVGYVLGYTGLGVGSSRFAAAVALDLVDGVRSELTELVMVRRRPLPFPPEPLCWAAVAATHAAMRRADRRGRRGPWLRLLDRAGVGFDS